MIKIKNKIDEMYIEQNTISRDWSIRYKDKEYYVNLTYSDWQVLALINRNHWEIYDENGDSINDFNKAELSDDEIDNIIAICAENFLNDGFRKEIDEVLEQAKM